jgi:hypothetical protein
MKAVITQANSEIYKNMMETDVQIAFFVILSILTVGKHNVLES